MGIKRKPFQGVINIIRFNWHLYFITCIILILIIILNQKLPEIIQPFIYGIVFFVMISITISLIASFYIYDISELYQLKWLKNVDNKSILNINAGFDEISAIIKNKHPNCQLTICDFYNPIKHTELSIKRARNVYPPVENTICVQTDNLPFSDKSFDFTLAILSAHEIREERERNIFFKEINRVTNTNGLIFVTEHLRDLNNFIVYTIGFFHFHSKSNWMRTFKKANLKLKQEIKTTPFITTFILEKNGNTF